MADNTIDIIFGAKGDKDVIEAIKALDTSTKKLISTQASLAKAGKSQVKQHTQSQKAMIALDVKLRALGTSFTKAKIDTNVLTKAYKGNKRAIAQVRLESQKYIKTLDRKRKGILDTEHGTRILGGSFAVLRSKMLLASFGAGLFGASIGKLTKLFGEQEQAEKKLETAIGRHSSVLLAFASAQQKVTTFGDEELINAMSLAGAYTTNEKAIARITTASMDLAKAKGMDLNSAVDLVAKSIFSSTNALSRYGIEVKGTTGSTKRLEEATKNISKLYGGQAQANAETFLGSMNQLSNSVGDLGEKFGSVLAPSVMLGAKGIKAFADSIDTEEIKAYGVALVLVAGTYIGVTKGSLMLSKAMIALNKVSKKNLLVFAGMVAIGAIIDKFNFFADSTEDLTEELKKLEGAMGDLNSTGTKGIFVFDTLRLAQIKQNDVTNKANSLAIRDQQNHEKLKQLRESLNLSYGATADQFKEMIGSNSAMLEQFTILMTEHTEIEREQQKEKIEMALQSAQMIMQSFNSVTNAYKQQVSEREKSELKSLKNTLSYQGASSEQRKKMEEDVTKKFADEKLKIWKMEKFSNLTRVAMDTASGVMKAYSQLGAYATPVAIGIGVLGAIQAGIIASQKPPKFEQGGMIGGQRHSQGGTMIEAERGEFIMSRSAVQSVGVEALNQMNQGGGGGLTLNISAPLVDETIIDTIIPAIQKAQRMNLA